MAGEEEKSGDFYAVLGLNKKCTASELRDAYKKLALKWHPDRCSASGNSKFIDEAKKKFQDIQEAYSVLSDENKRFLYDVGAYESDDDENGMGDFLGEMAAMMCQTKPSENAQQCFEDLQNLFDKMFGKDMEEFNSISKASSSSSSISSSCNTTNNNNNSNNCNNNNYDDNNNNNKRNCSEMSSGDSNINNFVEFQMGSGDFQNFCVGAEGNTESSNVNRGGGISRRRNSRKQRSASARIPV